MENKILLAAVLDGYSRRKDGSCSIRFNTSELSTIQIAAVDTLYNRYGVLYFCDKEQMNNEEINSIQNINTEELGQRKSQAQRMRSVLYLVWRQEHEHTNIEFDKFYFQETEKIINQYKNKLHP
jgi:hypothetical protein